MRTLLVTSHFPGCPYSAVRAYPSDALGLTLQGKPEDAVPVFRRALEGREKSLDSEYPDTLHSVHALGLTLNN